MKQLLLKFVIISFVVASFLSLSTTDSLARDLDIRVNRITRTRQPRPSQSTENPLPSSTPNPSTTATPTPVVTTPAPIVNTPPPTTGLLDSTQQYILNAINDYRRSLGLSTVQADPNTCSFAKIRAQEISTGFNHDGFSQRIANKTIPYPGYHLITENLARTSDYTRVVNLWINSPGHAENMRKDTPYVCVAKYGDFYAYEGWKP